MPHELISLLSPASAIMIEYCASFKAMSSELLTKCYSCRNLNPNTYHPKVWGKKNSWDVYTSGSYLLLLAGCYQ